jgi:hypothetical protein
MNTMAYLLKSMAIGFLGMSGMITLSIAPLFKIDVSSLVLLTSLIIPIYSFYELRKVD